MLNFREWVSYHKILDENYIIEDTEVVSLPPKVLWITGMASTGDGPKFLNNMGYDCKAISTLTSRKAAYIGRFERYAWAKMFLQKKAEKLGKAHMAANVEKHNKEIDEFEPDVIVGTSQGGAVVMEIIDQHPNAKVVLGNPAWKIFHADPSKLPHDTIVIAGKKDWTVPYDDSVELAEKYGLELISFDGGHSVPWAEIVKQVNRQLVRLGITPPSKPIPAEILSW